MSERGLFDKVITFRVPIELANRYESILFRQFGKRMSMSSDLRLLIEERVKELERDRTANDQDATIPSDLPAQILNEMRWMTDILHRADPDHEESRVSNWDDVNTFLWETSGDQTPGTILFLCAAAFARLNCNLHESLDVQVDSFLARMREDYGDDLDALLAGLDEMKRANDD